MRLTRRTIRFIALFFLTETVGSIIAPTISYALTTGPNQTEFTSYEPVGTTDMVNLITGDFTYNTPLIDVPGPEGGFTLPLAYHSGIGLEDEASWAGLGWNINPGSISRSKVSSADDDYDNVTNVNVQDPGGSGYIKSYGLFQRSWDSEKGYGGVINLLDIAGVSWNDHTGLQNGSVMGTTFNKDKASFDVGRFFSGLTKIASTAATAGASTALSTGMDIAASIGGTLFSGSKSQGSTGSIVGGWNVEKTPTRSGYKYRYWLDNNRREHNYGALYLGQMKNNTSVNPSPSYGADGIGWPRIGTPASSTPALAFPQSIYLDQGFPALTSDMYTYVEPGANYAYSFNPTHIAYDAYSVMGPGIGGSMAPYRPDVGALNFPKRLNFGSSKVNLVPFLEEGVDIDKIQFKYNGDLGNSYVYHNSGGPGISISSADNGGGSARRVYYQVTDPKLTNASQRIEADRDGLYNKKLAQGKHVEWFSNDEMASNTPSRTGRVMEYKALSNTSRTSNRSIVWPRKGIGAYAITNADGTTYHYALPVYNKKQEDFTGVSSDIGRKFSRSTNGDVYSRNAEKGDWYATTWLLTGITGPDFVDKGEMGSIDGEDLGYWVKFDYGRFAEFYQWRFPYTEYTQDGDRSTYSKGLKETYYLNTIQTRTHTALFLKDIRKDGRGAYTLLSGGGTPPWAVVEDFKYPASSLLLSEIVLLNNADFQQLQSIGFDKNSTSGTTIDRTQLNAPASAQQPEVCSLRDVFDVYDVQENPAFRTFLDQKAQRKVKLNTSYTLCPSTINSFASAASPPLLAPGTYTANRLGKLTLNSVSYYGPSNVKLFPDFKFLYNSPNPAYNKDAWDGWGSYNATGSTSHYSGYSDPTAWHLTDIISPLGGRITVGYESDDYSSISGEPIKQRVPINGFKGLSSTAASLRFDIKSIAPYNIVDRVLTGSSVDVKDFNTLPTPKCLSQSLALGNIVLNTQANSLDIQRTQGCPDADWKSASGYIDVRLPSKRGGGVRVASITMRDESDNAYKTGYIYGLYGNRNDPSSGVVAQEPELVRTVDYPFYQLYDFPNTPVLYSKVTVVEGMKSDSDFTHKTEYTFNTPDQACIQVTNTQIALNTLNWPYNNKGSLENSKLFYFDVRNRASRVGRLERIRTLERGGNTVGDVTFGYTDQVPGASEQGKFTSGSILCEVAQGPTQNDNTYFKLSRTNNTTYPNVLLAVQTTSKGVVTTKLNTAWDFLTGKVTQEETKDAIGQKFQTNLVPAYTKYPEMRSKAENAANKHMLDQSTAAYTYKMYKSIPMGVVSASVQTWNKDWTDYRTFNATSDQYEAEVNPVAVWRKHKSFVWNDNQLGTDGTTATSKFTDFNWVANATQAAKWLNTSEITKYNHYSRELEAKNINGDFTSNKYGYNQTKLIAQVANARYTEFAYSGAEDATSWGHFSGEVRDGGRKDPALYHTGAFSTKLMPGQTGFSYRAAVGKDLTAGRTYRLSAWVHSSDVGQSKGKLYATLNGAPAGEVRINSNSTKRAGNWCLLNLDVAIPANATGKSLVVGCQNTNANSSGAAVYFDDFRFHPLDAPMQSYVYDTQSWQPTYTLDGDNLYTHYEYDAAGQLAKVYKEVLTSIGSPALAERLIKESSYNYARNSVFAVRAILNGSGKITSSLDGGLVNQVEIGNDVRYTAESIDCRSLFNRGVFDAIKVDGVAINSDRTLTDGTRVSPLSDGCLLSNVRGAHTVELKFTTYEFEEVDTRVNGQCEICETTQQNTGVYRYQVADGCGGYKYNGEFQSEYSTSICPRGTTSGSGPIADCPVALSGVIIGRPNVKRIVQSIKSQTPKPSSKTRADLK
ncbi:hypothetical protein [Hymenobacter terrenus]|uniref:hypothetical protein n=1 Tax=Hymenobacter terrenus TaxID=1629124 RepID=UPI0006196E33|nr:hypothetical protein [Hymenobacter terrenus]